MEDPLKAFRDALDKTDLSEAIGELQRAHDRGVLKNWLITWAEEHEDSKPIKVRYSDVVSAFGLNSMMGAVLARGWQDCEDET